MKHFIFLCFLVYVCVGCNDANIAEDNLQEQQQERFGKDVADNPGLSHGSYAIKDVNPSTYRFDDAVKAFEQKDYDKAAGDIRLGTAALMTEGAMLKGDAAKHLQSTIDHLNTLADKVQAGKVKDMARLQSALAVAELNVAHQYAAGLQEYTVFSPLPDAYYPHYKAAIQAVQGAEVHLTESTKIEARNLIVEAQQFLDRMDAGDTVPEADIKAERAKLDAFLAAHI